MTRLIDLTQTLDPANRVLLPPQLAAAAVLSQKIEDFHPKEKGADDFCKYLGCTHDDLPDSEGWSTEILTDMSSHCGTHVDAPLHIVEREAFIVQQMTDLGALPLSDFMVSFFPANCSAAPTGVMAFVD